MKDGYYLGITIELTAIALATISLGFAVGKLTGTLKEQYLYQVNQQLCEQDAERMGGVCQLERDTDGTYNWYMQPAGKD